MESTPNDQTPPAAAPTAGPRVQSTINVADNQGTVIGTQIINQAKAAPALHQLRAPVGDFVGRAEEIDTLVQALSTAANSGAAAIGCVRGMAGVGKTELAYMVAQQLNAIFSDAQLLVDLRGVSPTPLPPAQALQTIIRAFEREAKLPDDLGELTGLYAAVLAGKRALILADDAQDAAQVRALLPPPGCALLITSRNRFALPAMRAIDLDTLPEQAAEQLLLAVCPRIGADAEALAKECGYLPLALRISAGLLATNDTRPVASCLARVGAARLSYLSDPDDPTASVETSLQLSYADLTPDGQAALSQLSVFPTSFDAPAAVAVVSVAGDASEALELLRRTSLLEWDAALERYNLQDLVRVFGAARLDAADPVWLRHAQHYLKVASSAVQDLYLKGQALAGLALYDRERAQIDAGWQWARERAGDPDADQLLLDYTKATIALSFLRYDTRTERIPQLQACMEAAQRLGRKHYECVALGNLGSIYGELGDMPRAIDYYEQALAVARASGERGDEGVMLDKLGLSYALIGDPSKANDSYEQALAIMREIGDRRGESNVLGNLAVANLSLDDLPRAIAHSEQQLAITREIGDKTGEAKALGNLGVATLSLNDVPKAITYWEQQLAIVREIGDQRGEAGALDGLGLGHAELGDSSKAVECYEQALTIARAVSDRHRQSYVLGNMGSAYVDLGDPAKAIACFEQQLAIAREIEYQLGVALASQHLSELLAAQGDLARAVELMQVYVDFERSIDDPDLAAKAAVLENMRQQLAGAGKGAEAPAAGKAKRKGPKAKAGGRAKDG